MALVMLLVSLVLAPLLPGLIQKVKALVAGRTGPPWLQTYAELHKLLQKGAVYSRTTSPLFWLGPLAGLACLLLASTLLPWGPAGALIAFEGDFILLLYLLALARFLLLLAALDTGSSFEGMGASREAFFASLSEPALLLSLAALASQAHSLSLTRMVQGISWQTWGQFFPALLLLATALGIVFLTENSRIPVDDPTTHLELTMIHEVMVLDHSGPDLAGVLYGSYLKLWLCGALIVNLLPLATLPGWLAGLAWLAGMAALGLLTGLVESSLARLRLVAVPKFLASATALSALALVLLRH